MIKFKMNIDNIEEYQNGDLPINAVKLQTPTTTEMQKKAFPIAVVLCLILCIAMFCKTYFNHMKVIEPVGILIGFILGFMLLGIHEYLHAVVYPKKANVTIGKLKHKFLVVALASYPLKQIRFIIMCLLPLILGLIPLSVFIFSSPNSVTFNGIMFGMAGVGLVSPYPDIYNVLIALKQTKKDDSIMFYKDDMYRITD